MVEVTADSGTGSAHGREEAAQEAAPGCPNPPHTGSGSPQTLPTQVLLCGESLASCYFSGHFRNYLLLLSSFLVYCKS